MKKKITTAILLCSVIVWAQEAPKKTTELNEVIITKTKKAIEQKADRTIFDFSQQPQLNSGTLLEGIKKLPGLIASDVAGMMYQGKQLDVFMDGRPLNISSNELNSFLEGMPANAIDRIEIITQPGAEFPATSGGAIINLITSKNAKNYLSANYTNSTNFNTYDKLRWKVSNSVLLSAKNKLFGWQLNVGQNYRESASWSTILENEMPAPKLLSQTDVDRVGRGVFAKSGLTFDIGKDRLLLNYDINFNKNSNVIAANGDGFASNDGSKIKAVRQEAVVTYQKKFADRAKKLDFKINYSQFDNDFNQYSSLGSQDLANTSLQQFVNAKIDYAQGIKFLDAAKMSTGILYESLDFSAKNAGITNLDYNRSTAAAYLEFQTTLKKFDFIIGTRAENYDISGESGATTLTPFKKFKLFPNASVQYNIFNQVYINANYNKKITLPSTSALNPNNTNYQNPNVTYSGNPQLQPTIFDNYEIKMSAFDYVNVGYNVSVANNQVVNRIVMNNGIALNTNENIPQMKIHNFNLGLPIPYMVFRKGGFREMMKFNFNPDQMNFMYAYVGYQKHEIPGLTTKGFWIFNLSSQIILPKEIKFVANFNYVGSGGNYFYFIAQKPFSNSLNLNLSKKFLKDQMTFSVNVDDVFNGNVSQINAFQTPLYIKSKNDTRRFGFTINYKLPTKNKLAKEGPSILNKEKKEEGGLIAN